jgi:hypothetical protein
VFSGAPHACTLGVLETRFPDDMSGAAVPVSSVRLAAAATYGHSPYMCMHALVPGDGEGEGLPLPLPALGASGPWANGRTEQA